MEREEGFEVRLTVKPNQATVHAFLSFRPLSRALRSLILFPAIPHPSPLVPRRPGDIRETANSLPPLAATECRLRLCRRRSSDLHTAGTDAAARQ